MQQTFFTPTPLFSIRGSFTPPGTFGKVWKHFLLSQLKGALLLASCGWGPATLRELRGNHRPGPAGRWRAGRQAGRDPQPGGFACKHTSHQEPQPGLPRPPNLECKTHGLRPRSLPHLTHVARAAVGGRTHLLV